ncbi:MAG: TIGR02281 family clan AA aspartic protease [Rhodobacteraceae bacterium]|nr:TIGR02281 family clan AA aspartic protease [Paracoccaceae bacterium]
MDSDDYLRLTYLLLLLAAVGGYVVVEGRRNLSKTAQQAAIWGLIFLGIIAGYGLWPTIRDQVVPSQAVFSEENRIEVPRAPDGHYYLELELNDVPVDFVVDTGASDVVLTQQDAKRIGLNMKTLRYAGRANTANGTVKTAAATVETIRLGPLESRGLPVVVNGGEMEMSLLGMEYLDRFARIEISRGRLILEY